MLGKRMSERPGFPATKDPADESKENSGGSKNRTTIFFLGAGASVEAGVPDTKRFVEEFIHRLKKKDKEELEILEEILKVLKRRRKRSENEPIIDIELVLRTLDELNNKKDAVIIDFYNKETFHFNKSKQKILIDLEKKLRQFIREKTIVAEDKIDYLAPLADFSSSSPLTIFSVNYDTCIELFCIKYGLKYTDGFGLYWNPKAFEEDADIKLFKIHGSVMWYLTDKGNYVKIPIKSKEEDKIDLLTGETASTFIVYPTGRKWRYTEPLSYLMQRLQKELKRVEVCVVVGYSFRDEDIVKVFFEASKENKDLTIILVSPDAGKVFTEKLKFMDKEKKIPSPLSDEVICFNYPFENVLKDDYLYKCINKIPEIKGLHAEANKARREGIISYNYKSSLEDCVLKCIEIGHVSLAEEILEKELDITIGNLKESPLFRSQSIGHSNHNQKLKLYMGLGVNHLLSGHHDKARQYFEELRDVLKQSLDIGKEYFTLNSELHELKSDEDNQKINEINQEIDDFERRYDNLPFYKWFINYGDNLSYHLSEFLNKPVDLRSKEDVINQTFSKIIEQCNEMKKCVSSYGKYSKYNDSKKVEVRGTSVEVDRKEDSEEKLVEIIGSIDNLIALCEKKD